MRRSWLPLRSPNQLRHTLFICVIGVLCTVLVGLLELYFINTIAIKFVAEVNDSKQVVEFLKTQEPWLYYSLIGLLSISILGLFLVSVRFTNRIFGPQLALDRDIKKLTFLGQLNSDINVRRKDFLKGLIRQYKLTCEDMDTVHELYVNAYKEIDEALSNGENKKAS